MKFKTFQVIAFTAEVIFFILTGAYFAKGNYGYAILAYILGSTIAVYLGKRIESNAIEKYKEDKQ